MKKFSKDLYYIAVKTFLEDRRKLFIFRDRFGDWDLPGGRIRQNEFSRPLEKVIARKVHEELGNSIRYQLGKPVVFMRHERREAVPDKPKVRIFAIGYQAWFRGGKIRLSSQHTP